MVRQAFNMKWNNRFRRQPRPRSCAICLCAMNAIGVARLKNSEDLLTAEGLRILQKLDHRVVVILSELA